MKAHTARGHVIYQNRQYSTITWVSGDLFLTITGDNCYQIRKTYHDFHTIQIRNNLSETMSDSEDFCK